MGRTMPGKGLRESPWRGEGCRNATPPHSNRQQAQADRSHPTTEAPFLSPQRGTGQVYQLLLLPLHSLGTSLKELAGKRKGV